MVAEQERVRKRRSQAEKVGRLKYILQVQNRILRKIEKVEVVQRVILAGLEGFINFEKSFIEKVVCKDEVDCFILQVLFEAGRGGMLPKDVAATLRAYGYKVTRHHVSRRLKRMNRRLEKELEKKIAEKRGWRWALTSFAVEIWGETEEALTE